MKNLLPFLLFFFLLKSSFAQVNIVEAPARLQLYPRANDDSSTVAINGTIADQQWNEIIYSFQKNNITVDSASIGLTFNGGLATFSKNYRIVAGKILHNFHIYLKSGNNIQLVLCADSVVCGDAYIINGQSNATANATVSGTDIPYLWVRSFGNPTLTPSVAQADTSWGLAQGNTGSQPYSIGVWGIRLGKMLSDSLNVPVCIINGARPGTDILDHLAGTNAADLNTLYGRLLYRCQKSKTDQFIKAIFWYQGESIIKS